MKKLLILLICLLAVAIAQAQTSPIISADIGTEATARTPNLNLGLAIGLQNWKGDYGTIGGITKTYGNKTLVAVRITGLIMVNEWLACYTQGDVFLSKDGPHIWKDLYGDGKLIDVQGDVSRMELGAGMGIRKGAFLWLVGAQFDDYDPISKYRQQPALFSKITVSIPLTPLNERKRWSKRISPKGFR